MKKRLQEKIDEMSIDTFMKFYNSFDGYKSESREIIKTTYIDESIQYFVKFTYTLVDETWFHKGDNAVYTVEDPIVFESYDDAELYVKEAVMPISHACGQKRWYINIKDAEVLKEQSGMLPEALVRNGKPLFGLNGTNNMDRHSFSEFLHDVRFKYKYGFKTSTVVNSYDINNLASIKEESILDDINQYTDERNVLVVKEIRRTEQYLNFLKTLLK